MVLGVSASRFGHGAVRHEGGGGSVSDGGGASCRALLLPGICWQGLEVVKDVRGGLALRFRLCAGLGLGLGFGSPLGPWYGGGFGWLLGGGLGYSLGFGLLHGGWFGFWLGCKCGDRWGAPPPRFAGSGSWVAGAPAAGRVLGACVDCVARSFGGWCVG